MPSATPHPSANATYPLVILDVGASSLRITLQPSPTSSPHTHTVPNCILRTRPPHRTVHIGSDITSKCTDYSCATIRSPIERGFITDWMAQKTLWDVELPRALAGLSSASTVVAGDALLSGWNVLITEAYFNLPDLETGLETLFLEEYGASAIWRTTAAQLASFAPMTSGGPMGKAKDVTGNDTDSSEAQTDQEPAPLSGPTTQDVKPPRPPARSKRTSTGATSQPATSRTGTSHVRRPEACLMIDLGHSYTHVVPLLHGSVIWSAVRRLDIGGKLMTNLLKEAISFTQWDVMEESWIVDQLKRSTFFVAASHLETDKTQPSAWDVAALARLKRHLSAVKRKGVRVDPIEQEFVLPDYTDPAVARDPARRYGRLRNGPGMQSVTAQGKRQKINMSTITAETVPESERETEDAFIADPALVKSANTDQAEAFDDRMQLEDDDDEEEDAGEDYHDSGSDSDSSQRASTPKVAKAPKAPAALASQKRKQPNTTTAEDEEDEQAVRLSAERWQIPELLFHPEQIGLDALGLSDLIYASINAASEDPAVRGLMYANICAFGGMATLPGLRRRLELDVKSLADEDYCVRVRTCPEPPMAAINGALHVPQRVFQARFLRKEEWQKAGNAATALARGRFGGWGAPPAGS